MSRSPKSGMRWSWRWLSGGSGVETSAGLIIEGNRVATRTCSSATDSVVEVIDNDRGGERLFLKTSWLTVALY